jgi:hypothetical protein
MPLKRMNVIVRKCLITLCSMYFSYNVSAYIFKMILRRSSVKTALHFSVLSCFFFTITDLSEAWAAKKAEIPSETSVKNESIDSWHFHTYFSHWDPQSVTEALQIRYKKTRMITKYYQST